MKRKDQPKLTAESEDDTGSLVVMKAAGVCRMREAFLEECRRHDYMIPSTASRTPSVLQGLENLTDDDVIDKSVVATRTAAIQETLGETDQKISQLCQQLKGQLFTKGFLIRVSALLSGDSVDVTEVHIAGLVRQVEEISKALQSVTLSDNFQFCSFSQDLKRSQIYADSSSTNFTPHPGECDVKSNFKSAIDNSVTGRLKPKPVAAVRSKLSGSSHEVNLSTGNIKVDSIRARPRSAANPVRPTSDSIKVRDRVVGSFHGPFSKPDRVLNPNSCSSGAGTTDSSPNLPQTCETSVACGQDQMSGGSEDEEESPYDNVITLHEYLTNSSTMFRSKRSNASKTDLERSNTLSSKDNFLAVTSKHVAPSNILRSNESTTDSPLLGKNFQLLKMTAGFDFVLDDSANDTQQQLNGSGEAKNDRIDNNVIVDSHASVGGDETCEVDPKIDLTGAENGLSSRNDSDPTVDTARCSSQRQSDRKIERGEEALTKADHVARALDTKFVAGSSSGPGNVSEKRDSHRLTPTAPPACEVLSSAAHSDTSARSGSPQAVTACTAATNSTSASVVERTSAGEDNSTTDSGQDLPVAGKSSLLASNKNMDSTRRHPAVPLRSPPTSRGGVNSVPPPVAVKLKSFRSGKVPPPVSAKPTLKPSQSAHAQLSGGTTDRQAPSRCHKIDETSGLNRNFKSSHPHSSPLTSPLVSKLPNPHGTAPKPGARGSINGIAEIFGGISANSNELNKTDYRKSRDCTPSPPVSAQKRVSGTTHNTAEDSTHSKKATCDQVEKEEGEYSKLNQERDSVKCVSEKNIEGEEEDESKLSALETAVKHSTLAGNAVAWPQGLEHPKLNSSPNGDKDRRDSNCEQLGDSAGIGELVGRTHSSLLSIHSRLHRGGTVDTTTATKPIQDKEDTSLQANTTTRDLDVGVKDSTTGSGDYRELWEEELTSFRMYAQDSVDTIVNASEGEEEEIYKHKPSLDRSVSFTSDQDVREAISILDAIIKSDPEDDSMDRNPSLRLSTASTTSSVGSNPRPLSTPTSPIFLRRQQKPNISDMSSSRRKSSSASSYENWTINRAVTRFITSTTDFDLGSEEEDDGVEEVDDEVSEGVTSPFPMKRGVPAKGSKDSGLCDDISLTSDSGHVMSTPGISVPSSAEGGGAAVDLAANGKIRDLKALRLMTQCADEDEEEMEDNGRISDTLHEKRGDQDMDSISVASDIVFIPGSRGGSRIRKYAAEQQGKVVEEDEEEEQESSDVDISDGGGSADHSKRLTKQQPHTENDIERDESCLSGSSSPEWQHGAGSNTRPRLSHEMSDSFSVASSGEDEEPQSITMDSSYDETDSAREGMLKMRQLLVKGVLDSEKVYLDILTVLINYKKLLETNSASTQPVISREDVDIIFSNIETIYRIHSEFVTSLEPKVKDWHHEESIGEIFKIMISKFIDFGNYLTNYKQAVSTIHRCSQDNEQFQELAQKIVVTSTVKESSSLEDALFKPVQRVQRNTLVLHDLIKYTPQDHPDHEALQKALKLSQHILETFATAVPSSDTTKENRRLVKSSFLVELVNGVRKLRYVFLFSDVLVCTKRETHRNNKVTFEPKWFTPLSQANFDTKFDYTDDTKHTKREDIDQLKSKLRALKKEMREEMKKFDDKDKHRSIVSLGGATRVVEKLRKKISQYEAQLILASPKLPFKISLNGGKVYTLLMTTDYEREEWKETIRSLCSRNSQQTPMMSSIFVQDLINSVKETPQVNKIGSVLLQKDEDILTGTLNVTIHKMNGLTEDCDTYCCLEMDSFGHFFMKARTNICEGTRDPAWNEDFELELESSQTLRFLCFKRGETGGDGGDTMLGRGALELSKQWLKGSFQEKTVSMNEISLVVSVKHTPAEKTMQRTPSRVSAAVFGVKITSLARREGKTVPTIVTACLQEVEKRGLDELGIYRVSGVTSELQRIKKLFDKNIRSGAASLSDVDINAVTGILKLYFRELPEPLFTEACYQNFIDTLKLQDEEAKAECMLSLLHGLPDTNYYTIVTLLEHLIKVARNVGENKMSIHNLSTIFGPTLLAPATNQTSSDPLEMMCKGAEQVLQQSGVVNYLLGLAVSGRSLRRSA